MMRANTVSAGNIGYYHTGTTVATDVAGGLSVGSWSRVTITWDNSTAELFADAVSKGTDTGANDSASTNKGQIGGREASGTWADCKIDEVQIADVVRSDDWITTEFNTQSDPSTFYSIGVELTPGGGGPTDNALLISAD